jgi:hypothetical protein
VGATLVPWLLAAVAIVALYGIILLTERLGNDPR